MKGKDFVCLFSKMVHAITIVEVDSIALGCLPVNVSTPFHSYNKSRTCYINVTSLLQGGQNNLGTLKG